MAGKSVAIIYVNRSLGLLWGYAESGVKRNTGVAIDTRCILSIFNGNFGILKWRYWTISGDILWGYSLT